MSGQAMTLPPLVLVGFEPDWVALYVYGKKRKEGHHVTTQECAPFIAQVAIGSGDTTVYATHVEEDEADEFGEHEIPELLADIPPLALARISS